MLQDDPMAELQTRLGYTFVDSALLTMGLTHRSWANEQGLGEHYERTEFLGDAVLGLLVAHWLYTQHPTMAEGELSKLKSHLVSEPVLAEWARALDLGRVLRLGIGEDRSGGRTKPSLLADALEAVLGAIYLDGGLEAVRQVTDRWLSARPAAAMEEMLVTDAKTTLQELAQAQGLELPVYRHVSEAGPEHEKRFFVECWLGGERVSDGSGGSKKQAEQSAARAALVALQVN
jgi:ribonuclease-3